MRDGGEEVVRRRGWSVLVEDFQNVGTDKEALHFIDCIIQDE